MKAVTAPFALLSGAFSGGDESGAVNFAPGSAQLDAKAKDQLSKIVKALNDRPALKMTVAGESREAKTRKRGRLWSSIACCWQKSAAKSARRQECRRHHRVQRGRAACIAQGGLWPCRHQKARNMVGMAKDLPADQMKELLVASIKVPDDAMRELALARVWQSETIWRHRICRWSACSLALRSWMYRTRIGLRAPN